MARLGVSDRAFGTAGGISITEDLDLVQIAADLSAVLGVPFSFDGLDLTRLQDPLRLGLITATGNSDPGVTDTLVLGNAAFLSPASANGAGDAFSLFERLQLTDDTMDAFAELFLPFFELSQIPTRYDLLVDRDANDPYLAAGYINFDPIYYYSYYYYYAYEPPGLVEVDGTRVDIDGNVTGFDFSRLAGWEAYVVIGDTQDSTVSGSAQGDRIVGGDGNDSIAGDAGDDELSGGRGVNTLDGGEGDDLLLSQLNPLLTQFQFVGEGSTELVPIISGEAQDTLTGGPGNDLLLGRLPGAKSYAGDAGNDVLFASPGATLLTGGADADRFYLTPGDEAEIPYTVAGVPYLFALPGNLGFSIPGGSPTADQADWDTIADFTSASNAATAAGQADLLIVQVAMSGLGNNEYRLDVGAVDQGQSLVTFIEEENFSVPVEIQNYTIIDETDAVTETDVLLRAVPDPFFYSTGFKFVDFSINPTNNPLPSFSASVELAYYLDVDTGLPQSTASSTSSFDGFFGFQLAAIDDSNNPGTVLDGQDKIDLTFFGFTGSQVEDILFTSIVDFNNQTYLSQTTAVDFFADSVAGADRAVHVEYYDFGEGVDVSIYVDTNSTGDFEPLEDLFFQLLDPTSDGFNSVSVLPTAELIDLLYSDPNADGTGSGIFIFNDEQYGLWFDPGLVPSVVG